MSALAHHAGSSPRSEACQARTCPRCEPAGCDGAAARYAAVRCAQLLRRATWAVSIDQYVCITEKMYAVLTPNSSIPYTASNGPISCQGRWSVSPDAPRVLIESSE